MKKRLFDGFVRVVSATLPAKVADCSYNAEQIISGMRRAAGDGASVICLHELCVTGYTCGDLFLQDTLIKSARAALSHIARECADLPLIAAVGLPLVHESKLYNVAAILSGGKVLGFVPKTYIPNYVEFYEMRHFTPAPTDIQTIRFDGYDVPFGTRLLFRCESDENFTIAAEICEDLWVPSPPSSAHATAGAVIILNPSASNETVGKAQYRRALAALQSGRCACAYLYSCAGHGESTSDVVFSGHDIICENGSVLAESMPFADGWAEADIDLYALAFDRRKMNSWRSDPSGYRVVEFSCLEGASLPDLKRRVPSRPFVPDDAGERNARCEAILDMQVAGLEKRLAHTGARTALIGVSGGLDSCLALLVTERAMKRLGHPVSDISALTMPCFGTTARTKSNALALCEALGVPCAEIDITDTVRRHFGDIGVSEDSRGVVYENAQARVRTLVLMDLANKTGGLVVGTGDLSELALGWSTYNGDHMSMYGVNAGVPKTLVRHIVKYVSDTVPALRKVLEDILATPVSPELLPPSDGKIEQKTEDIIGPYELHDFFLYHAVRWGRSPSRILLLAEAAFDGAYTAREILKWMRVFFERFFAQQFKRSCLPDGPKIGSVSLSPRGDWRMPSDAAVSEWAKELEDLGERHSLTKNG
ncbi:MAG: NAD(+) synthase [Synergistaceae bacterium]|nr:NAD(+) synthase [Synergistaceae bacterium]